MNFFQVLRGTFSDLFQLGKGGPNLKKSGSAIEARNNADAAYAVMRGATPVASNDLTTKAYVDAGAGGAGIQIVRLAITSATTTLDSTTALPATAEILRVRTIVTTPFSAGATIELDMHPTVGGDTVLQPTTENDATTAGAYESQVDQAATAGALFRVVVGGTPPPVAGVGVVEFEYTNVPNA